MKELTCIVCPNGCELQIDEKTLEVKGNRCIRGAEFAKNELVHPSRTICSTVKTIYKDVPVVPVRVNREIPKEKMMDVMNIINQTLIDKRLKRGDVLIENILDTGADIIITSDILINEDRYGKR